MILQATKRLLWPGLLGLALFSAMTAMAAANTVPVTGVGISTLPITANALKPAECAGLNLVDILAGGGTIIAGGSSTLVLGSAGDDNLVGGAGDDCIVGGPGNDSLKGNGGNDVCVGGPGADFFAPNCETIID